MVDEPGGFAVMLGGQVPVLTSEIEQFIAEFSTVEAAFHRAASVVGTSARDLATTEVDESGEMLQSRGAVQQAALVIGLLDALIDSGVKVECIGGMSLGGLIAATAAGALPEVDLYGFLHHQRLVPAPTGSEPAQGMAVAILGGGMDLDSLIGPRRDGVHLACDYDVVADDGTRIVVLAGTRDRLEDLVEKNADCASLLGGYVGAFHSPLVTPVARFMQEHAREMPFVTPSTPLVTAQLHPTRSDGRLSSADDVREFFIANYTQPVGAAELLERLRSVGNAPVLGLGPGLPQTPGREVSDELDIVSVTSATDFREFLAGVGPALAGKERPKGSR